MKNDFRIWDTDTHIHPTLEVVAPYFDPGFRARLPELEPYKVAVQRDDGTMTGGRFFSSIEMHEGEDMIKMVMDFLGDGVLMYASDYPHPECKFPESPDHALGWKSLSPTQMRKMMWDNAVRFYGEP